MADDVKHTITVVEADLSGCGHEDGQDEGGDDRQAHIEGAIISGRPPASPWGDAGGRGNYFSPNWKVMFEPSFRLIW